MAARRAEASRHSDDVSVAEYARAGTAGSKGFRTCPMLLAIGLQPRTKARRMCIHSGKISPQKLQTRQQCRLVRGVKADFLPLLGHDFAPARQSAWNTSVQLETLHRQHHSCT